MSMLKIGSVIDNKYKILSEVGHGGMSTVYLAINERANKTWAVKEVRKDGTFDFEAVKQGLVVETDMLKKFNHPHLPSIIDVIDLDDSFLIVMDYIEGRSLKSVLENGGAQDPEQVIEWGKQICDVLGYLHSRTPAIIYRDMKPANLMLKPDGNVMLIDFGTAREFKNRAMVEDTTCLGTRGYAAPEQFGGMGETTPRTDIYCTGATLYHLLTGHSPAEPPYEIKPLSYWDPTYAGTGLEKIIIKCCQQDPAQRYQSCAELMYALENVHLEDDVVKKSRNRRWWAFMSAVIVCLLAIIGMFVTNALKSGAEEETYDYCVAEMEDSADSDFDDIEKYCKKAIKIAPDRPEAYQVLVDRIGRDSEINEGEKLAIEHTLAAKDSDGIEYMSHLQETDREAYDYLCYDLGLLYYFMPAGTVGSTEDTAKAAKYFDRVAESTYLKDSERELANSISKICTHTPTQNGGTKREEDSYDYEMLWQDYMSIVSGEVVEKVGRPIYAFKLCQQVASQLAIKSNCEGFLKAKIKLPNGETLDLEGIKSEIGKIKEQVEKIDVADNENLTKAKETALALIGDGIKNIEAELDNPDDKASKPETEPETELETVSENGGE